MQNPTQKGQGIRMQGGDQRLETVRGVAAFTSYRRMPQFVYRLHELTSKSKQGPGDDSDVKADNSMKLKLVLLGVLIVAALYLVMSDV